MMESPPAPRFPRFATALWLALALFTIPFVIYSLNLGFSGLLSDLSGESRFYDPEEPIATMATFVHMASGAFLTFVAPLQVIPFVRKKWPILHRATGYALISLGVVTGAAGLTSIALVGTIGGPLMSAAFALYGALVLVSSLQTLRFARKGRYLRHRRWALRLTVLALGSWLYRVHYGVWYATTGGVASNDAFTGLFDQVTLFAFFLPYLLLLELIFAAERRRAHST